MGVTKEQSLQAKISRLIWDIAQLSNALADDPQYDRHWKPRLERLLDYVSENNVAIEVPSIDTEKGD